MDRQRRSILLLFRKGIRTGTVVNECPVGIQSRAHGLHRSAGRIPPPGGQYASPAKGLYLLPRRDPKPVSMADEAPVGLESRGQGLRVSAGRITPLRGWDPDRLRYL